MITNFPHPFPDELLYSVIARHGWLHPASSLKTLARRVFGTPHALAIIDLPGRLGSVCEAIGNSAGLDIITLVRKHTLLPLYAPFMPSARLALLEKDLAGNGGGAVHCRAGITASRSRPPLRLRFCPSCAAEERAKQGEAYWHRLHQVAGVFVCPTHKVFLQESSALFQFRRTRHAFVAAEDVIPNVDGARIVQNNPEHHMLLRISEGADWLLQNYRAGNEPISLQQRYHHHAMRVGLMTGSGRIRWKVLLQEFKLRFPNSLLEKLGCSRPEEASDHWLARIFRRPRVVQAPIRHLALIGFLGLTPEAFFNTDVSTSLFGAGPWRCDNPVCPCSGEATITLVQSKHSHQHRRPVALFTCPACGQTKCRVISDNPEISWVREFGRVWEGELSSMWEDPQVSLRGIAQRLHVDPMTVMRHAAKAGLAFPRQGKRIAGKNGPPMLARPKLSGSALGDRRAEWLRLTIQNPSASITEIRHQAAACYTYLYRHDRAWLKHHSPLRPRLKQQYRRVDWTLRDRRLAERISQVRTGLLEEPGRPKRISVAAVGRKLGASAWLQKHLSKLPYTKAALTSAVESRLDFARRRLTWAAGQLKTHPSGAKAWLLIRLAGLRPELMENSQMRAFIKATLHYL